MQSPKFPQKAKHLQNIVSASTLQKLWKNHVRDRLRRQIVPDPVEFLDFHIHVKQRCWELESVVCSGGYLPRPVVRLKVEKSKGLCRQIALPSPEDALLLHPFLSRTVAGFYGLFLFTPHFIAFEKYVRRWGGNHERPLATRSPSTSAAADFNSSPSIMQKANAIVTAALV